MITENFGPLLHVQGAVLWLCEYAPLQAGYDVETLIRRISPSLECNQFRYYDCSSTGRPAAFVNWAKVSDGVLWDLQRTGRDPLPDEWQCGENIYFVEMLAPFGHCRQVISDLKKNVFKKGQVATTVRGRFADEASPLKRQRFHV